LKSFVRPIVVVLALKPQERHLLLPQVSLRRTRRLLLQGLMHALVTTILLGVAWLDPLMPDSQPQPQHG
jgi:hypothetical protein